MDNRIFTKKLAHSSIISKTGRVWTEGLITQEYARGYPISFYTGKESPEIVKRFRHFSEIDIIRSSLINRNIPSYSRFVFPDLTAIPFTMLLGYMREEYKEENEIEQINFDLEA